MQTASSFALNSAFNSEFCILNSEFRARGQDRDRTCGSLNIAR